VSRKYAGKILALRKEETRNFSIFGYSVTVKAPIYVRMVSNPVFSNLLLRARNAKIIFLISRKLLSVKNIADQ
jgi:hypothetical protein